MHPSLWFYTTHKQRIFCFTTYTIILSVCPLYYFQYTESLVIIFLGGHPSDREGPPPPPPGIYNYDQK